MENPDANCFDKLQAVENDILDCVQNLLNVKWDSNTIKLEIQELMKQRDILQEELISTELTE